MSKEIYISTNPHETRLAIVEDEQLTEIYFERENEYTLAGSIYNGKVTRVLPGMQSAFVDVGLERDAFLYVTDFMEEQGDAADFESDGGSRRQPQPARENGGSPKGSGRRPRNDDAAVETESTESFDEPVAPAPEEAVGPLEAGATGSRRWRGRRGRRQGRGMRDEHPVAPGASGQLQVTEEDAVIEGGYIEEIDAVAPDAIEIDLSQELTSPETSSSRFQRENRSRPNARDKRVRGGRGRGADRPAPRYDNSYAGYESDQLQAEPEGEPVILPGESIRKYRDPSEVAAEDAQAALANPRPVDVLTVSVLPVQIAGWDGGAVLPGESLSRHGRSGHSRVNLHKPQTSEAPLAESFDHLRPVDEPTTVPEEMPSPMADAGALASMEAVEQPAGLMGQPEHEIPATPISTGTLPHVEIETTVQPTETDAEYEPVEGASASVADTARRDLRRYEQVAESQNELMEAGASEVIPEVEPAPATPDQTTYDLNASAEELPQPMEDFEAREWPQEPSEPNLTTLQPNGEMLSLPENTEQEIEPLPSQDVPDAAEPIAHEYAVQSVALEDAAMLPVAVDYTDESEVDLQPAVHTYGDGDLQEEEIEGELDGDDYEYDAALASIDDEVGEYEEETLEDGIDLGSVLHEMSVDSEVPGDEPEEAVAVASELPDDLQDEDEEEDAPAAGASPDAETNTRERRPRRPANDKRRGSWNNGGSERGRGGRRQTMQMTDLPAINELLKPGQEILVQIAKEPIAKKGARITSHIALPGRFLVFMPTVNHTGVSRKISSDEERRRLKSILLSEKGDAQGGFIVRTAAASATEEELRNDLRFLIHLWNDIQARSESSKSPALIYHDLNLVERILRDQVTDNFSAIWVDTEQEYERVLRFLQRFQPSLVRRVKLYTKETPLFEHFGVTQEIDKALKSKVWLKSGGSIVINQTEALVAIDINTGKYVGKTARLEDTIIKTNLDAIPEIVRQIRLRDLGGIIVIDFIDMDDRKNRAKVLQALEDAMRADRAPSKILPFNDFGLVIMTRKRVKQSLERTLCMPDPVTEGTGMIKSPITIANEIYVEMRKMHRHLEKTDVLLRVHPEVVKTLKANGGKRLQELEEMTHKTILVKSDPALSPEAFDIA